MDFELSLEQQALRDAARAFLAERWSSERMRAALDNPPAHLPEELWSEIAGLGWPGIAMPQDCGGSEAGLVTAAVIAEEAGRALLPGPYQQSVAAGVFLSALSWNGASGLLARIAGGETVLAMAIEEPARRDFTDPFGTEIRGVDGCCEMTGTKIFVYEAELADAFLVAANDSGEPAVVLIPATAKGVTVTPMRRVDGLSISEVVLDSCAVEREVAGESGDSQGALITSGYEAAEALEQARVAWTVLSAADLLGQAEWLLAATVEYAKTRIQFGKPIGAFQAVSHRLADMAVDVEIARGLVYGAALAVDESRADAPALASAAKAWTSEITVKAAESSIQLHGGVGFTWELDVHLYLRRARAEAASLGTAGAHKDFIAGQLEVLEAR